MKLWKVSLLTFLMMCLFGGWLLWCVSEVQAREVWADDGFKVETAGWVDSDIFPTWTGVKLGVTMPHNGYIMLDGPGSLELFLPGMGWVTDVGVTVVYGCDAHNMRDTKDGVVTFTEYSGCNRHDYRVILVARLPKFYPSRKNIPVNFRWVQRKAHYHVEED